MSRRWRHVWCAVSLPATTTHSFVTYLCFFFVCSVYVFAAPSHFYTCPFVYFFVSRWFRCDVCANAVAVRGRRELILGRAGTHAKAHKSTWLKFSWASVGSIRTKWVCVWGSVRVRVRRAEEKVSCSICSYLVWHIAKNSEGDAIFASPHKPNANDFPSATRRSTRNHVPECSTETCESYQTENKR